MEVILGDVTTLVLGIYYFAGAALTKYHRLCGLNNRNLLFHSSRGWKFKIKVLLGLVSGETSVLGLQVGSFWARPHVAFPLCTHGETELWRLFFFL